MFFESLWLNIAVALGLIVALTFDYVTKYFSYWYVRHIPYKTSVPFYGSDYHRVLGLRNNTTEVNTMYKQYPEEDFVGSVKSRIPDLTIRNPDLIKEVLSTEFNSFRNRGLDLDKSQDICLRNNLFYVEGEKWTLLRERLEHLFNNVKVSEDNLHRCLSGINGNINVHELLTNVLDSVFKNMLFDESKINIIKDLRLKISQRNLKVKVFSYLKNIFPSVYVMFGLSSIPKPSKESLETIINSKFSQKVNEVFNLENKDMAKKIKSEPDDLCFGILSSIISEGYIPCLNVLSSLLFELARNPDSQIEARKSGDEYIDAVINETLRLYAPMSVVTRKCVRTYKFSQSKVLIDKGITINIPVDALHKDKTHFEDPELFKPERFLKSISTHSYAYLPYGAGPRKCVGEQLSQQLLRCVTKGIVSRYNIEPTERTPQKISLVDHNFGRVLDTDIWLRFTPL